MATKRIEAYLDIVSPYSFYAFTYLRQNKTALAALDVELEFIPVFLGGINVGSGNKPPWTLAAKANYSQYDSKRAQKYFGVKFEVPSFFPILSLLPQRCLTYLNKEDPEHVESLFEAFFHAMWYEHRDLSKVDEATVALLKVFDKETTQKILQAASSPEIKQHLNDVTTYVYKDLVYSQSFAVLTTFPPTSVAVLGNNLILQGGVVNNGNDRVMINDTQIIRLDTSWTNESVKINTVVDNEPVSVFSAALFPDKSKNVLYHWGGSYARNVPPDKPRLFEFEPDGSGGGSWSTITPTNSALFEDTLSAVGAPYGVCGRVAVSIGGSAHRDTDSRLGQEIPLTGVITYNMDTGVWGNDSSVPINPPSGAIQSSEGVCIDGFGPDPLFMILGGSTTKVANIHDSESDPRSMSNITFYNPVRREWHWQKAKGDVPPFRRSFCITGASSTESTFEMYVYYIADIVQALDKADIDSFLYGGTNDFDASGDVYVLSIPGFQWFRVDVESPPRYHHACASAGRQIIVSGGVAGDETQDWDSDDPWPNALGVFDLSALEWSSSFDPSAEDYELPQIIQDWYNDGGVKAVDWSTDSVKGLFAQASPSGTPNSETPDPENTYLPPKDKSSDSDPPVAKIAGGVVGGLAGLALIGAIVFVVLRRRRRASNFGKAPELDGKGVIPQENMNHTVPSELEHPGPNPPLQAPAELDPTTVRSELDSARARSELQ
ncbi:Kelch repeat-containing protein [Paramyrothecium foliicola]|nr:Kelch repeat-containing protein [Paramyrothecium foliicola]